MNKAKLKSYAPSARRDFIQAVTDRANFFGISASETIPVEISGDVAIIGGRPFPRSVAEQRRKLDARIKRDGFELVMEAVAFTWFNRFLALRYMELHGYLEHGYRVLSNPGSGNAPEILEQATNADLPGLNKQNVIELKLDGSKDAELYRMLLVAQCNALHSAMPFLFERIEDETELLLPDNLLHSDSLIRKLVTEIEEEDWEEVEIIGWLYQFYISEKKDQVIGKVVKSEDIPAATQLFTPNWIVKYMVQNSLGRQWMATYPNSPLKAKMEYYIEPAEQTEEVIKQLKDITPDSLEPEKLTLLDPASGSGHILVEAYDVFKEIYLERGYSNRDFPRLILEKNLYGLDIDDRAAQMAGFALLMKARKDDRRILRSDNPVKLNVIAIQESEFITVDKSHWGEFSNTIRELVDIFTKSKTYGSLIQIPKQISSELLHIKEFATKNLASDNIFLGQTAYEILPLVEQAIILSSEYDCVVANPPYMGGKYLNPYLKTFLKTNYDGFEKDLFSAFMIRNLLLTKRNGQLGFMSPFVWMFISSYEQLRKQIINNSTLSSLVQLEYSGFDGATVPICTFTVSKLHIELFESSFIRLTNFKGSELQSPKTLEAISNHSCGWFYLCKPIEFNKISGSPIAFWVNSEVRSVFEEFSCLGDVSTICQGLSTADNNRFIRFWQEVNINRTSLLDKEKIGSFKWYPIDKGGGYRKWYGNNECLINWEDSGKELISLQPKSVIRNQHMYFKSGITWGKITSAFFSARFTEKGHIFSDAGMKAFPNSEFDLLSFVCYLCSNVSQYFLSIISQTLNFEQGNLSKLPYKKVDFTKSNNLISLSKSDWDSVETSWDFSNFPLLTNKSTLSLNEAYTHLRAHWKRMVDEMQLLEVENNRIFIENYNLFDVLTPEVPLNEITLICNPFYRYGGEKNVTELECQLQYDTMRELISYSIGCMMGRYSLDQPGLVYANSGNIDFDSTKYATFPADDDGIVPVMDMDWFPDDATSRFEEFLKVAQSPETIEENLKFVAESLSPKGGETPRETIRRYVSTQFYKDHMQTYKKRPIYWLFSSGKQRAFECLVYLHRYNESTLSRMRNEYVTPLQGKFSAQADYLSNEVNAVSSTADRNRLQKQLDILRKKQIELASFDDLLRHYADQRIGLDLDEGVKENYGRFGNLLSDVKAITGGGE